MHGGIALGPTNTLNTEEDYSNSWKPLTDEDVSLVREQLQRMLATPLFTRSKRYHDFLRYVVEKTLAGKAEELKERTIGVEVFGRTPMYDTGLDAVVRITAGEVRKRIAQYYHENGHEHEILIELHAGSYIPEFLKSTRFGTLIPLDSELAPETKGIPERPKGTTAKAPRWWLIAFTLTTTCIIALCGIFAHQYLARQSPFRQFWRPVLESSNSVLICVGEQDGAKGTEAEASPTVNQYLQTAQHILIPDGMAMSRVAGRIQTVGQRYSIKSASATTFTDLQQQPVVLIGGLDNKWTRRFLSKLRYRFSQTSYEEKPAPPQTVIWNGWPLTVQQSQSVNRSFIASIVDTENPSHSHWDVNMRTPYAQLSQDYAIVARMKSSDTGRMTLIAAGLGAQGTVVAAQFLTQPGYLNAFLRQKAPKNWQRKNIEIVLETKMINGQPGPPRVVAAYFW